MEIKHNPITEMVLHREMLWHSSHDPVTSECQYQNINQGRWAGLMDLKYPMDEIIGRVWVAAHESATEEEYPSLATAAAAIGMQLAVRETKNGLIVFGRFDTSSTTLGKRHVWRVEGEIRGKPQQLPEYHTREEMEGMLNEMYTTMRGEMHTVMDAKIATVREGVTQEIDADVEAAKTEMTSYVDSRTAGRSGVGVLRITDQRVEGGASVMLTNHVSTDGSALGQHFLMDGCKLRVAPSDRNRILRILLSAYMDIGGDSGTSQWWVKVLSNNGAHMEGAVSLLFHANRDSASWKHHGVQAPVIEVFIPAGTSHPATITGLQVQVHNATSNRPANLQHIKIYLTTICDDAI